MPSETKHDALREQPTPCAPAGEFAALIDELYREEVLEARAMSPEEKFLAGEELFHYACSITLAGIRNQFPEADEQERQRILRERVDLRTRLENHP
jgi:hypothetical protein